MGIEELVATVDPTEEEKSLPEDYSPPEDDSQAEETSEVEEPAAEPTKAETEEPSEETAEEPAAQKTVPLAALHEERTRRQELQRQLEEYQELRRRLDEVRDRIEKPAPATPEPPNPEEDPIGYLRWENEQLKTQMHDLRGKGEERFSKMDQQAAEDAQWQQVVQSEQAFRRDHPDFTDAVAHLRTVTVRGLQYQAGIAVNSGKLNPSQADAWINNQLIQLERQTCLSALQQGLDPADYIYGLSEAQGYTKAKAAAKTTPAVPVVKELDQDAKRKATRTLGPGGAAPAATEYGDDILEAFLSKNRY